MADTRQITPEIAAKIMHHPVPAACQAGLLSISDRIETLATKNVMAKNEAR